MQFIKECSVAAAADPMRLPIEEYNSLFIDYIIRVGCITVLSFTHNQLHHHISYKRLNVQYIVVKRANNDFKKILLKPDHK